MLEEPIAGMAPKLWKNAIPSSEQDLLAVDMQNFVCSPKPGQSLPGLEQVMRKVNTMADICHEQGIPVVWLRQCFSRRGHWGGVCLYGAFHQDPLEPGMFNQGEATEIHPETHMDPETDWAPRSAYWSSTWAAAARTSRRG